MPCLCRDRSGLDQSSGLAGSECDVELAERQRQPVAGCLYECLFARPAPEKCFALLFHGQLAQALTFRDGEESLRDLPSIEIMANFLDVYADPAPAGKSQYHPFSGVGHIETHALVPEVRRQGRFSVSRI